MLQIVSFDIENILFYVNGAFGKEVPQRACTFCPFQELYTHFYCEIGCFRARFASLLNLSFAQIAVAAIDVRSKRYRRDAPASVLVQFSKRKMLGTFFGQRVVGQCHSVKES